MCPVMVLNDACGVHHAINDSGAHLDALGPGMLVHLNALGHGTLVQSIGRKT